MNCRKTPSCSLLLLALLSGPALAQESPEKEACRQQEAADGKGETAAKLTCAVKVLFQSRIRRRAAEEPVEMTVGSPPMRSEDSETPGDGNWEINVGMTSTWGGGEHRIELPTLDINYGKGERWQFTYEVPYAFVREGGEAEAGTARPSVHGVGDSQLGIKYRFYDNADKGLSFAFYPQLRLHTPGASDAVSEGRALVLPLIMVREFQHASITADVGLESSQGEHRYFASFGAGRRLNDHLALLAEVVGTDLNAGDARRLAFDLGLRRRIDQTRSLSAAIGRDFQKPAGEAAGNYVTVSYQKLFGE